MEPIAFTTDMALAFGVVLVTVALFLTDKLRVDVVALLVMVSLPLLGLIDGAQAFSGLSSNAVVSIIAVIIMGRGLDHTGAVNRAVRPLTKAAGSSRQRMLVLLSLTVGVISSFMQNVGAAALFLPAIRRMCRNTGVPAAQLLMPVGFAAILGGTVTLVGSSPLIMLNDLMRPFGLPPFGLFSVTPAGLALVATGTLYFLAFGPALLGKKGKTADDAARPDPILRYPMLGRLYELRYPAHHLEDIRIVDLCDRLNVHTVGLQFHGANGEEMLIPPDRAMRIPPGGRVAVYAPEASIEALRANYGFEPLPALDAFHDALSDDMAGVVEALVPPQSQFLGKSLGEIRFRHNHLMAPLALLREDVAYTEELGGIDLQAGDTIIMHGRWESFHKMRPTRDLLFVQSMDHEVLRPQKAALGVGCFALATLLVIFSGLPLAVCLMAGAVGMVVTGVLTIDEAYRGVDWRTVFLLAGLIPLGAAMQQTGAAGWLAQWVVALIGDASPLVFLFILGAFSTAMTLVVSNVGAVVLLVPLAVDMAMNLGADPRAAALTVALAASNSFILPTHQVNALYMGPGKYTSMDFAKAGAPLTVLFLVVLTLMMRYLY